MVATSNNPQGKDQDEPARYRDLYAVPEFRLLAAGSALQLSASMMITLTLSVVVYQDTRSPLLAAVALAAGFLPHALGATFLLAIGDRSRPRRTLVGLELLRAALAVVLAMGHLPIWAMLLLVMSVGVLAPVNTAIRSALLPDLLRGDAYVLGRSVMNIIASSSQIVGAAVGSAVLAAAGPTGAFTAVAIACTVTAAAYQFGLAERPARGQTQRSTIAQTWHVNGYLLRTPVTRGLLLAQCLPLVLVAGAEGLFVPYADAREAPDAAGSLFGAAAAGMLLGDIFIARFFAPRRREQLALGLALLLTLPYLAFALQPGIWLSIAIVGAANVGAAYQLGLQRRFLDAVPEAMRGQALGLVPTGIMTMQGITMSLAGWLAERWTPSVVMPFFAGLAVISAVALARHLLPACSRQQSAAPRTPVHPVPVPAAEQVPFGVRHYRSASPDADALTSGNAPPVQP